MDDATALSERIARRELSCVELMRDTLERIGRVNPRLNAIVSLREREALLAEAAGRDAELARGERRGWMHGLPHAIKDLEETAGIVTTLGLAAVRGLRARGRLGGGAPDPGRGRDRDRQDQRARVRLRLADLQPGLRADPQPLRPEPGPPAAPAAAPRPRSPRGWCRSPTAATTWARCATRPRSAASTASGRRSAASCSPPYESAFEAPIGTAGPMARTPARPRRAAGDARRPAPRRCRSRSRRTRRRWPRRSSRPTRAGCGSAGSATSAGTCRSSPGSSSSARPRWPRSARRSCRSSPASTPPPRGRRPSRSATTTPPGCSSCPPERLKPELRWEADGARAVTGPALHAAQRTRTQVAAALRALLADHDALALPSAQVFPFDVDTPWPGEVAGRAMPTYHRWMEVVDLRLARRPAGRRRARGLRARRAADGPAADRPPARRPRAARARRGLRPAGLDARQPRAPLGSPPCPSSSSTPCRRRTPA